MYCVGVHKAVKLFQRFIFLSRSSSLLQKILLSFVKNRNFSHTIPLDLQIECTSENL